MASSIGAGRTRAILWSLFGIAILIGIVDGGSCALARIQIDNDAKTSARYAVQQIAGLPVNQETAVFAYQSAVSALPNDQERIIADGPGTKEDFRVGQDKSITMTVTREAPTFVFKYIPGLEDLTTAKITYTQQQLGM